MDAGEECDCGSPKVGSCVFPVVPGQSCVPRSEGTVTEGRFCDIHSPCVLRNVRVTRAASQERAGSDPVLNVLMVTAAKTARYETLVLLGS